MLNSEETTRFKLSVYDTLDASGLNCTDKKGLTKHFLERGSVITANEDGSFTFLGESLAQAIDDVKYSKAGAAYFEPATAPVVNNPNIAESALEKAMRANGLTAAEWDAKDAEFRRREFSLAEGAPGATAYQSYAVKAVPFCGKTEAELSSMSLEDRLAVANEAHFKAAEARKPGASR